MPNLIPISRVYRARLPPHFHPLGQLSCASLAVAPENQTCPNLNNIKCTYAVNFTQFYK